MFRFVRGVEKGWGSMSPAVAKVLRQYACSLLPKGISDHFPGMANILHRKLKSWWQEMPARKRHSFLMKAKEGKPLPDEYRESAIKSGIILDWPPKPITKKPSRGRDVKRTKGKVKRVSKKPLSKKL